MALFEKISKVRRFVRTRRAGSKVANKSNREDLPDADRIVRTARGPTVVL